MEAKALIDSQLAAKMILDLETVDGAKQWLALVLTPSMDPPFTLFGTCFVQIHRQKPSPETFTTSPCRVNCKLQCILLQAF